MIYSSSPSCNSMFSPSFLTTIPSSSDIALKTFKTSSSEAPVISNISSESPKPGSNLSSISESSSSSISESSSSSISESSSSSISESISSIPFDGSSFIEGISSSSSSPIGCSDISSVSSSGVSNSSSSISSDSLSNSLSSFFITEESMPFAFCFTASSSVLT